MEKLRNCGVDCGLLRQILVTGEATRSFALEATVKLWLVGPSVGLRRK